MALEDFAQGFTRTFAQGAQQGQEAYQFQAEQAQQQEQFNERQALRERAFQLKKDVQQKQIDKINQQMRESRKKFPHELTQAKAGARAAESRADVAATEAKYAPKLQEATLNRKRASTKAANAQAAKARAGIPAARAKAKVYRRQLQRRKENRRQRQRINQMLRNNPPARLPSGRGNDPYSLEDVGEQIWNFGASLGSTYIGQGLLGIDKDKAYRNIKLTVPDAQKGVQKAGRNAARSELAFTGALQQKFLNANPGARSEQAAVQALRRIGLVRSRLQAGAYGFDAEERKQMLARVRQQENFFTRYAPKPDKINQKLRTGAKQARSNESFGAFVDMMKLLNKRKNGGQQTPSLLKQ